MSIKVRNLGLRGSSGSSGGSLAINNTDSSLSNEVAERAERIVVADGLEFIAYADPDNEGSVIFGTAPTYLDSISWLSPFSIKGRISEADVTIPTPFDDNNEDGQIFDATNSSLTTFTSTVGTGFGAESLLTVTVSVAGNLTHTFTSACSEVGTLSQDSITVTTSNYAVDGNGGVYQGKLSVAVDALTAIGSSVSGVMEVHISFFEQMFGKTVNKTFSYFYDNEGTTPTIDGDITISENISNVVTKYISGISYYTTGSEFTVRSEDMNYLLDDSSSIYEPLVIDAENFGISSYTADPYRDAGVWENYSGKDSDSALNYEENSVVNMSNVRWVGSAQVNGVVRDPFVSAVAKFSPSTSICLDTYTDDSSSTIETFNGESYRLGYGYSASWDSTVTCKDGDAIVFGGKLMHGRDLHTIKDGGTEGADGTASNLNPYKPDINGTQPNYSGYSKSAVFFREFLTGNDTTSYQTITMTLLANEDVSSLMADGSLKIYMWKLDSADVTSINTTLPEEYNTSSQDESLTYALWGHEDYNFINFDDGESGSVGGSGCIISSEGDTFDMTFGGYSVISGILVRFQLEQGAQLKEVSVVFNK